MYFGIAAVMLYIVFFAIGPGETPIVLFMNYDPFKHPLKKFLCYEDIFRNDLLVKHEFPKHLKNCRLISSQCLNIF